MNELRKAVIVGAAMIVVVVAVGMTVTTNTSPDHRYLNFMDGCMERNVHRYDVVAYQKRWRVCDRTARSAGYRP